MIGGVVIFMLASIACMLATSFAALVAWRFVQAVGISVGTVASRAIIATRTMPSTACGPCPYSRRDSASRR